MRLMAIDGMCLDVPPTAENDAEFGYPGNTRSPGPSPRSESSACPSARPGRC